MRSITIQRQHGLLFVVSTVIVLLTIVLFLIKPTSQAQGPAWAPLAAHPQASLQPATKNGAPTVARYLWNLKAWNEHLYAGYGDYGANGVSFLGTQFAITPFDPKSGSFASSPVFQFDAEAVPLYRDIAGRLFAPNMDVAYAVRSTKNFAFGTKSGAWAEHSEQLAVHIFDVATLNLTDVWMVGADCTAADCNQTSAVAWRSTDGGATFQISKSTDPPVRPGGIYDFSRFYFAGVLNNRLYVQAVDIQVDQNTLATISVTARNKSL